MDEFLLSEDSLTKMDALEVEMGKTGPQYEAYMRVDEK